MAKWKYIEGWEERYEISDSGEVRSWYYGIKKLEVPRMLKLKKDKYGYLVVSLHKKDIKKCYTVHRLVAKAFIPNPESLPQINHVDGNKENNSVFNLEWCTSRDNMRHAFERGLISKQKQSLAQKKRYESETERNKSKTRFKSKWSDPEYRSKMLSTFNSSEYKSKISERRKNQSPPTAGTKRINNGIIERSIKLELLNEYLDNGWKLGRLSKKKGR